MATPFSDSSTTVNNCTGSNGLCTISMDLSTNYSDSSTVSFGFECLDQVYSFAGSEVRS